MKDTQANSVAVERNHESPTNLETIDPKGQLSLIDAFLECEGVSTIEHDESAYLCFMGGINAPSPAKDTDEEWMAELEAMPRGWEYEADGFDRYEA